MESLHCIVLITFGLSMSLTCFGTGCVHFGFQYMHTIKVITLYCKECPCFFAFFFKQKTAYEISLGLVGSEMCIRDRISTMQCKLSTKEGPPHQGRFELR